MKPYRRASKKQLAYIETLCQRLDIINKSLYTKYSNDMASKYISQLKNKLEKQKQVDKQTKLL